MRGTHESIVRNDTNPIASVRAAGTSRRRDPGIAQT
jgi:hypothetical protein